MRSRTLQLIVSVILVSWLLSGCGRSSLPAESPAGSLPVITPAESDFTAVPSVSEAAETAALPYYELPDGYTKFWHPMDYSAASEVWTDCTAGGIGLYYGDNVFDLGLTYVVGKIRDRVAASEMMQELHAFLLSLPAYFLDEMTAPFDGFDIYLLDSIRYRDFSQTVEAQMGLTAVDGNRLIWMLDVNGEEYASSFAHGLMHLIELSLIASGRECFSEWESLLPPGYDYFYTYIDSENRLIAGEEYIDHTYLDAAVWQDASQLWFTDPYAKTFPGEDRARIMEALLAERYFDSIMLRSYRFLNKAQYLVSEIRDSFETLKNAQDILWEKRLPQTAGN